MYRWYIVVFHSICVLYAFLHNALDAYIISQSALPLDISSGPFNYRDRKGGSLSIGRVGNNYRRFSIHSSEDEASENNKLQMERTRKIKVLRSSTGRGSMECYDALMKANGDIQKACDILNSLDIDEDEKDMNEIVTLMDGMVGIARTRDLGVLIELRCGTDFVAKSQMFINFTRSIANAALRMVRDNPDTMTMDKETLVSNLIESFNNKKCTVCNHTINSTSRIAKMALKESLAISRIGFIKAKDGSFLTHHVHGSMDKDGPSSLVGTSVSLFSFSLDTSGFSDIPSTEEFLTSKTLTNADASSNTNCCLGRLGCTFLDGNEEHIYPTPINEADPQPLGQVKLLAKHLAMHIMGNKPQCSTLESLDPEILNAAKAEIESQIPTQNMKPEIVDKIINGKLIKKFGELVLEQQEWAFSSSKTVANELDSFAKRTKMKLIPRAFVHASILDDLLSFQTPTQEDGQSIIHIVNIAI
ncbi:bifunctional Elongation factor Ts [Babesia duncani]|uniref:Bifunctional Elongation factor Ts n=1 Tax=Babesia duncani TaxID=323732 RepID=A0AAD9PPF3_9APIC|nr:bifunctional Elongation factor Ts [Babesia duncani]